MNSSNIIQSPIFESIRNYLKKSNEDELLFLFVPYIKTKILEKLIDGLQNPITIITNWDEQNLLQKSSELELYPFCKKNNITLYSHDKIHLKVYSINLESAIIGSANISTNGLMDEKRYEACTFLEKLSMEDRLYLEKIKSEALWINDDIYKQYKDWYDQHKKPEEVKVEKLKIITKDDFSITALPRTKDISDLVEGYQKISKGLSRSLDDNIKNDITHDISNFHIQLGLSKTEFLQQLKNQFFSHPFILKIDEILEKNDGEIFYGSLRKELEQRIITDVPPPERRDVDECLGTVYDWFRDLGEGKYGWDRPKGRKHSQRLWKKLKN